MSIFRQLTMKERDDLIAAIRNDKYWKATSSKRDFVYVVALSRARVRLSEGFSAKATFIGRALLNKEAAEYCRKHRVLLVNRRTQSAACVLTWRAFRRIMKGYSEEFYRMLINGELPPYVNIKVLKKILKERDIQY